MEIWQNFYEWFLIIMSGLAIVVFVALQFVTVPYGMTYNSGWGISIRSNIGWMIMEVPVFIAMFLLYLFSFAFHIKEFNVVTFAIFILFQTHYLQRSFIFPILMRGTNKMPLSIIFTGFFFNTCNAFMQGGWLFFFCPDNYYPLSWFWSPQFIIGTVIFFLGMAINMQSDRIIRNLRQDDKDNNYYLPKGGFFNKINSANYFGELLEWFGFAILSWSIAGWVFLLWSCANIIPRSKRVYERYSQFWGDDFKKLNRYKIFPWIY